MAKLKQLHSEVEKKLKQVGDGCEKFNQLYIKVHTATKNSLREKYEGN